MTQTSGHSALEVPAPEVLQARTAALQVAVRRFVAAGGPIVDEYLIEAAKRYEEYLLTGE
jgi:hypothetical protein